MIKVMNEVRESTGAFGVLALAAFYVSGLKLSAGLAAAGRLASVRHGNALLCSALVGESTIRN
jgi:hypothetical protein